jgi:hypothetical protein
MLCVAAELGNTAFKGTSSSNLRSNPNLSAKKDHPRKDDLVRYWWWGGNRAKRLVVQEVRAADNTFGMVGITAKNQAVLFS